MATVLWGARLGDAQYAGIGWRRRNIPIGAPKIYVTSLAPFDVGMLVQVVRDRDELLLIVGMEADSWDPRAGALGFETIPAVRAVRDRLERYVGRVGEAIVRGAW